MDDFESVAIINQRYSLDGTTLYLDLITGVSIELHGKERTDVTIVDFSLHAPGRKPIRQTTRTFTLHNEEGPARISKRGHRTHRMWYLEGRRMSEATWKKIIEHNITMSDIAHERNAEIRMLMLRAMGPDKIVEYAKLIDESTDECGRPRRLWEYFEPGDEWRRPELRIRFVEVYNSSPPHERFLLYVPPNIETANAAVEWTFPGLPEGYTYDPDISS